MFEELLREYRETGVRLRRVKSKKVKEPVVNSNEVTLLNSMIAEVGWAVAYMRDGFNPDVIRGIHSREISMDPAIMDSIFAARKPSPKTGYVDPEMIEKANEILGRLTPREREAFLLVKVERLTYQEAGKRMGITNGATGQYVIRAQKKIKKLTSEKQLALTLVC